MNIFYIYKITNIVNNKIYIGQTNNPSLRWSQHKSNGKYERGDQVITRAITKYGSETFTFEIISSCQTRMDADFCEKQIIKQNDSQNPEKGYNTDPGGNTSIRAPETYKKISESLKKFYETHDSVLKGTTLPEEWKNKIAIASIGKPGTNTGKEFHNEWKVNISKSLSGTEHKSNRRFSEEIEKEICRLYVDEQKSTYFLGKQFDCYRTTIDDLLKRRNIKIRQSNYTGHSNNCNIFTADQEKEICDKYLVGDISRADLSKEYKCSKTTIRDLLIRYNVKLK